jgi:hypothetical protein
MQESDMDLADQIRSLRQFLEIARGELRRTEEELAKMQFLMVTREEIKGSIFGLEKMIERMETQQKNNTANIPVSAADIMKGGGQYFGSELGNLKSMANTSEPPIWRGAQEVLEAANRPMSAPEITECLQAMSWPISGETPVETVRTALARKPDLFERTERGMFKLKDIHMTAPPPGHGASFATDVNALKVKVPRTEPPPSVRPPLPLRPLTNTEDKK